MLPGSRVSHRVVKASKEESPHLLLCLPEENQEFPASAWGPTSPAMIAPQEVALSRNPVPL